MTELAAGEWRAFMITKELFKIAAPTCKNPEPYIEALNQYMPRFGINTTLEVAHFLAQFGHETGDFNKLVENTNYTSADRLVAVFSKYFYLNTVTPRKYNAKEYVGKPDKIANVVYANRYGNGSPESGDGYRYRGRGICQLTFKDNYKQMYAATKDYMPNIVERPEELEKIENAVIAGIWYWDSRKINIDANRNSVEAVTKKIQGAAGGIDDRKKRTERILKYMGVIK